MSENEDPSALWRLVDEAVAALPAGDRLAVRTAVVNSVLEGWQPTKVDVDRLAAFAARTITMEQYRAADGKVVVVEGAAWQDKTERRKMIGRASLSRRMLCRRVFRSPSKAATGRPR